MVNVFTNSKTPFSASISTSKGTTHHLVDTSEFFSNGLSAILDFFEAGKPNIDRNESVTLMKLLDAARTPEALESFVSLSEPTS